MMNWKQIKSIENMRDTFFSKSMRIESKVRYE